MDIDQESAKEFDIEVAEKEIAKLRRAFIESTSESDKAHFGAAFLDHLDQIVNHKEQYKKNGVKCDLKSVHIVVFNEANRWLDQEMYGDKVWTWILKQARQADDSLRVTMRITVFEMMPDEPINPRNLTRLFDLLLDADMHWIVASAYSYFPEKFYAHFIGYVSKGEPWLYEAPPPA